MMGPEGFHPELADISDHHPEKNMRLKELAAFFVLTIGALMRSNETGAQVPETVRSENGHRRAALQADLSFAQTNDSKDLLDGQIHWHEAAIADSQDVDAAIQYIMHKVQYDLQVNKGGLYEDRHGQRIKLEDEHAPTQAVFQEAVAYLRNLNESITPSDPRKKTIQEAIDKIIAHYVKFTADTRVLQDDIRKTVFFSPEIEAQQADLRRQLSEERRRLKEATGTSGPDPESPKYMKPNERDKFEKRMHAQKFAHNQRTPGFDRFPGSRKGGRKVGDNRRPS